MFVSFLEFALAVFSCMCTRIPCTVPFTFPLRRSRPCRNYECKSIRRRRKVMDEGDTEKGETISINSHFAMADNPILYIRTYTHTH